MNSIINYFIESSALLLISGIVYWIFFRNDHQLNLRRFFILSGMVLSLFVPLLSFPSFSFFSSQELGSQEYAIYEMPVFFPEIVINWQNSPSYEALFSFQNILLFIYFSVTLGILIHLFIQVRAIYIVFKKSSTITPLKRNIKIIDLKVSQPPFSFMNLIFFSKNPKLSETENIQILAHEEVHAEQLHSLDIVLNKVIQAFFWFHPMVWFFSKELPVIHEYIADRKVINYHAIDHYTSLLSKVALQASGFPITSSFYKSNILNRINMLTKNKKNSNHFKTVTALMIASLFVVLFSCNENIISELNSSAEKQQKIQSGSSLTDNTSLENQATPVHGYDSLYKIIGQQMKYPKKAVEENISGKVFISFDIDTEGNLTNSKIVKGIGAGCDEEALRVVQSLDAKWIPGVKDGQKINQTIVLPISFSLKSTNSSIIIENIEKGNSQGESSRFGETTDEIFTVVEDPAMPEGGYESFYKYIQTNMLYPETARNNNIEGRVFIQFVVDTDGSITQVQAVKGIGAGCDEEAIRVISGSPKWKPAYQRGITVKQRIVLPITFKL